MIQKDQLCRIGAYSFEKLIRIILQKSLSIAIEFYGGTKDYGKDAYHEEDLEFPSNSITWKGPIIFQMKFKDLIRRNEETLRKELREIIEDELDKILTKYKLKCNSYCFITNIDLTAKDIRDMKSIIKEKKIPNSLIIHFSSIQTFLSHNTKILWQFPNLIGLSELSSVLNKKLLERSKAFIDSNKVNIQYFVPTDVYFEAQEKLSKNNFVIFEGPPKMGKTMNAFALCFSKLPFEFEILDLRTPDDFFQLYDRKSKQIFVCDDVFGSYKYESSYGDFWIKDLPKILSRIDQNHQLIWATRTYIIKEALDNTKLDELDLSNKEIFVEITKLTLIEKAEILYNHIKFSSFINNNRFHHIISYFIENTMFILNHNNYSPELIRELCQIIIPQLKLEDMEQDIIEIQKFLDKPIEGWIKDFQRLVPNKKLLLFLLFIEGGSCRIEKIKNQYINYLEDKEIFPEFNADLNTLVDTYIKINTKRDFLSRDKATYNELSFYHPSIMDIIYELWKNETFLQNMGSEIGGWFIFQEMMKLKKETGEIEILPQIVIMEENIFSISNMIKEILKNNEIIKEQTHQELMDWLNSISFYNKFSAESDSFYFIFKYFHHFNVKPIWIQDYFSQLIKYLSENGIEDIDVIIKILDSLKSNYNSEFNIFFKSKNKAIVLIEEMLESYFDDTFYEINPEDSDDLSEYNSQFEIFEHIFNQYQIEVPIYEPTEEDIKQYYKDNYSEPDEDYYRGERSSSYKAEEKMSDEERIKDMFSDLK